MANTVYSVRREGRCKKGGKVTGSKGVEEEVGITDTHPHQAGHTCNPGRRTESSRPA